MTVTVKHSKTNAISDWTQAQLDEQIALGNFPAGTTLANIVLPSDWNNDHTLTGVGTMAEQNANSVAITGGSVNGTTIGATTASTGKFTSVTTPSVTATTDNLTLSAISTGKINLNTATANQVQITDATAASGQYTLLSRDNTGNEQRISANASSGGVNFGISSAVAGAVKFYTNGFTELQAQVSRTASAVNYVQVTGATTGNSPIISLQGSDGSVGGAIQTKGVGAFRFNSGGGSWTQLRIDAANNSINFLGIAGSIAGNAPILSASPNSSDTNVSLAIQPKGTGAIDLAAGSSGVNISNGGTVTAVTMTNNGTVAYTTIPSVAITAPTTAGGVQALGTANMYYNSAIATTTIVSGGTGYTLNDALVVVGGTFSAAAQFTVTGVSGGVITSINSTAGGTYSVLPTGTLSVTGGTGTGFTFTINGWGVRSVTVGTAGSGYIEQPTVSFSGGGGSGASAYATVGSVPIIRSLAGSGASTSSLSFYTPAGESVRINDQGITSSGYVQLQGASATSGGSYVTSSYQSLYLSATGGQQIGFFTNGQGQTRQFNISHTASAVNYVQVTGGATTAAPIISAQGSDTNITLGITPKGSGLINLNAQTRLGFNSTNYITIAGSATTVSPTISALGGDTNIDLALTPKGTGVVRFGTYTANMALTVQGYIEIKDSGGTLRKLAVIA